MAPATLEVRLEYSFRPVPSIPCRVPALRPRRRAAGVRACGGANAADGHLHQGRRADPPAIVCDLPPPRPVRADVAADLRRGAAVGALDQDARRGAADAA